jgi:predicted nuclease of predicted toxin-antitoxin system
MKFLANENFPHPSIAILRENGYDVFSIYESNRGISDEEVIDIARKEERIILTFDKDYGELIFKKHRTPPLGVVFFRYKGKYPTEIATKLLAIINEPVPDISIPGLAHKILLSNSYTTIEEKGVRQKYFL